MFDWTNIKHKGYLNFKNGHGTSEVQIHLCIRISDKMLAFVIFDYCWFICYQIVFFLHSFATVSIPLLISPFGPLCLFIQHAWKPNWFCFLNVHLMPICCWCQPNQPSWSCYILQATNIQVP